MLHGNTGILKCHIPSFVADFVSVDGWLNADDEDVLASVDNSVGIFSKCSCC